MCRNRAFWIFLFIFLPSFMAADGHGVNDGIQQAMRKIGEAMFYIENYYIDSASANVLADKAIDGIMASLDPHSVYIPAGVKHWHGAAPGSWFSHLAIEVPGEKTSNEWLEPVNDTEYSKLK